QPLAPRPAPAFSTEAEKTVAQATFKVLQQYEHLASSSLLLKDELQTKLVQAVKEAISPAQQELTAVLAAPDIAAVVAKATSLVVQQTIDIPRILVVPKGEVTSGFNPFKLTTAAINYQPVDRDILIQHLRTHQQETLSASANAQR